MALLCANPGFAEQNWWALARSTVDPSAVLDTCKENYGRFPSPASFYEGNKALGYPAIIDKGDEVDVDIVFPGSTMRAFYFRTLEACKAAARSNVDAADPSKAMVDNY